MAKPYKGILDGFSGKIGNIVGRKIKDQFVVTSTPSNPKKNKSASQITIESAMALCRGLAGVLYPDFLPNLIFLGSEATTIIAKFVEINFINFKTYPVINYPNIIFSQGSILTTPIDKIKIQEGSQEVVIDWKPNWAGGSIPENDDVYAVVINESSGEIAFSAAQSIRKDKQVLVPFFNILPADVIHCYLCFNRQTNKLVSNTSYKQFN